MRTKQRKWRLKSSLQSKITTTGKNTWSPSRKNTVHSLNFYSFVLIFFLDKIIRQSKQVELDLATRIGSGNRDEEDDSDSEQETEDAIQDEIREAEHQIEEHQMEVQNAERAVQILFQQQKDLNKKV